MGIGKKGTFKARTAAILRRPGQIGTPLQKEDAHVLYIQRHSFSEQASSFCAARAAPAAVDAQGDRPLGVFRGFSEYGRAMACPDRCQPGDSGAPAKITSFPRKRESTGRTMGRRFRGDDDADLHSLGWAKGPWGRMAGAVSKGGQAAHDERAAC